MRTRTTLAWCSTELLVWAQQQTYIVCTNQCLLKEAEKSHASSPTTGRYYDDLKSFVQFSSVVQSYPTLCDPMACSMPGFPVHHQLLELHNLPVFHQLPNLSKSREIPLCLTLPFYNICMYTHTHTHSSHTQLHTYKHCCAETHIHSHTHTHACHTLSNSCSDTYPHTHALTRIAYLRHMLTPRHITEVGGASREVFYLL